MTCRRIYIYVLLMVMAIAMPLSVVAEAIGTWKVYSCYNKIDNIQPAGSDIFVLARGSLYSYNVNDNSLTTYDKTTCLTGSGIAKIAWVQAAKRLVIAYSDCSLDFLSVNQDVSTLSDIADKQMTGQKVVNDIFVTGNKAYVSTGFGIVCIDVQEEYVVDTYNLGYGINYCYLEGGKIYGASEDVGLMCASVTDNLLDKNNWQRVGDYKERNKTIYFQDTRNNCYWAGDEDQKLMKYQKDADGKMQKVVEFSPVVPDGPNNVTAFRLAMADDRLLVSAGGWSTITADFFQQGQVMELNNGTWTDYENKGEIEDCIGRYRDANNIAVDPRDSKHVFVGGFTGLYEFYNGKFKKRYGIEDGLRTYDGSDKPHRVIVTEVKYDNACNMWFLNSMTPYPLWCITASGELKNVGTNNSFDRSTICYDLEGLTIQDGTIWFANSRRESPAFYRYDIATDNLSCTTEFYNQDGNNCSPLFTYTCTKDKRGNVWLGTSSGPFYLKPEDMASWTFTQHKVPRNDGTNFADYLLENIHIITIAVDAQNRKWIGTGGNGVFLISDDCNTQISHFTMSNSPLCSNYIYDILVDDKTGRVYFATEGGLCSFLADVTENNEGEMTEDTVWAYPNPVTPEHTGMITIVGLMSGAQVSIVAPSGHLVHKGTCSGGSYLWNGKDMQGKDVASGIYMVNVATATGESGLVTKIAVVR